MVFSVGRQTERLQGHGTQQHFAGVRTKDHLNSFRPAIQIQQNLPEGHFAHGTVGKPEQSLLFPLDTHFIEHVIRDDHKRRASVDHAIQSMRFVSVTVSNGEINTENAHFTPDG